MIIESFNKHGETMLTETPRDESHALKIAQRELKLGRGVSIDGEDVFSVAGSFFAIHKRFAVEVAA